MSAILSPHPGPLPVVRGEGEVTPWLHRNAAGGEFICAWCQREHGAVLPAGFGNFTHGICPHHFTEQMQALERPAERS